MSDCVSIILAPNICLYQLLNQQSLCLSFHYTGGTEHQYLAAATYFYEGIALVSRKCRGKAKQHLRYLLLPMQLCPLQPSILRSSLHLHQLNTNFSLPKGFSCLFYFISSPFFSYLYRFLRVDFNIKRQQPTILTTDILKVQIRETLAYLSDFLHFGYLFIVGQFSNYCLGKIKCAYRHLYRCQFEQDPWFG